MSELDQDRIWPRHIAIIMDGNGRWARNRGLPRTAGHKVGAEAVKKTVEAAREMKIEYLTLFGFSSENWKRPKSEVNELMRLLRSYLRAQTADLHKNGVCFRVIGDRGGLDQDINQMITQAESLTQNNKNLTLTLALNYGGRHDIIQAAARMAAHMKREDIPADEQNAAELFPNFLMTMSIPDPDMIIRTSGEQRISNFLLWQSAYSEMIFKEVLWPDFSKQHLRDAIEEYLTRDRRFGAMKSI